MKRNMKHRTIAMLLAAMMMAAPVGGTVFAADEIDTDQNDKPVAVSVEKDNSEKESKEVKQPEKPEVSSHEDNDKIEEYNRKVDEYNKEAEAYNESVDQEYEAAVEEVNQKNAEIDAHNEAEIQRVKTAEENNAKAVKDAEEANAIIDEENAAEEDAVNQHNANEDALYNDSVKAKADAEEENKSIEAHNAAVDQYKIDKEKYDADYAQYEYDLSIEKKIKALGYSSVEQYNEMINKNYNEPARASVEKNATAKVVSASDTYRIEEAEEKAGSTVKVYVEHNFEGTDVVYTDEFEIDRNDIITFNSIAALGNATQPGYAACYYNTDEDHKMGYWALGYVVLMDNARYKNDNWNCGNEYVISYKDGANHRFDEEAIDIVYNYMWMPNKIYKTYNVPSAPAELTDPGDKKDLIEVPELYTPDYKQFVKKDHVQAELEEVPEANILESIMAPVKKAYMTLLDHMMLFDVPAEEIIEETPAEVIEEEEPVVEPETPAAEIIEETPAEVIEEEEPVVEPETPAAEIIEEIPAAVIEEAVIEEEETIAEPETPAAEIIEEIPAAVIEETVIEEEETVAEPETPAAEIEEAAPAAVIEAEESVAEPETPAAVIEEAAPAAVTEDEESAPAMNEEKEDEKPAPAAAVNNNNDSTGRGNTTVAAQIRDGSESAAATAESADIIDQTVPMTESAATADMAKIANGETPLASNPVWALLNLILAICTGIVSAVLLAGYFGRKDERDENEDEDEDNTDRKGGIRILSLIPAAASVIAFILTENMSNPMVFTDRWTILMAVILLVQAAVAILAKKEVNEDEAAEEAAEGSNA